MNEHEELRRTGRPVAALFVLFGLLLNVAGSGPLLARDSSAARLGNGEITRSAIAVRTAGRTSEDGADRDEALALLPPPPNVVTELLSVGPANLSVAATRAGTVRDRPFPYRARAPPAA